MVGAREHNLKDITVEIPRDALVVITGLSGSGKSSPRVRHALCRGPAPVCRVPLGLRAPVPGQMDKPDVDPIEGLSPAISIDQKTTSRNPRSTVATVTEIYDYLRLLYARIGEPHCPICGRPIAGQSVEQIVDRVLALPADTRFMVLAPMVRGRKGEHRDVLEQIRGEGFTRVAVDGEVMLLDDVPPTWPRPHKHTIEVVVDRLVMRDDLRRRLTESLETATQLADGARAHPGGRRRRGLVDLLGEVRAVRSTVPRASTELAPAGVLVQQPPCGPARRAPASGPCPRSIRSWSSRPRALARRGRADPAGPTGRPTTTTCCCRRSPSEYEIPLDIPWRALAARPAGTAADRAPRRPAAAHVPGPAQGATQPGRTASRASSHSCGASTRARRRQQVRESVEQYMSLRPCAACDGARLRPESLAVTVGERSIHAVTHLSVDQRAQILRRAPSGRHARADRRAGHPRDHASGSGSCRRRPRLPDPRPRRRHALGRRGAAHPAGDPDRVAA